MITEAEGPAVETITPIQISQVHIFKSSNLIHNRSESKNFNNSSEERFKKKMNAKNKEVQQRAKWRHHP